MKIGVMGGTFDPIHYGHLNIAKAAYEEYGLDKIWFMTAGDPYFKQGSGVSSPSVRLAMTELAVSDYPAMFESSDMEVRAEGHTYSADTFAKLKSERPGDEFFFIIGLDSLQSMDKWYRPELLLKNAALLCAMRSEHETLSAGISANAAGRAVISEESFRTAEAVRAALEEKYASSEPDIRFIHTPLIDISSTMIRKRVRDGLDISGYVPERVENYIRMHDLYI